MRELVLGAGSRPQRILKQPGDDDEFGPDVVRLDINPDHKPDVVWNLNRRPLPFADNEFDRIHAYEILEHIGHQGDYIGFFEEFSEYWRILKPDGFLLGTVPAWNSKGALGDPSHVRVINDMTLAFLSQEEYQRQVGKTPMSDFRYIYKADFRCAHIEYKDFSMFFALQAVKNP